MFSQTGRFNPWSDAHRGDPHAIYREMRAEEPVYEGIGPETGRSFWFLTRYDDVHDALRNPKLGRDVEQLPPSLREQHRFEGEELMTAASSHMLNADPPDHTRLRRLVSSAFTPKRIRDLEPLIQGITDDLLNDMGGEVDLIHDFALPIPVIVIADLLGIPVEDLAWFRTTVDAFLRADSQDAALSAGIELIGYIDAAIEYRTDHPGDDLLSALIAIEEDGDRLHHNELTSMVNLLLIAGHETTVNLIGNGMLELMQHPEQRDRLIDDPALLDTAIEEMVRYNGPVETSMPRIAYEDVTIRGVTVPAGDMVIPVLAAANRDQAAFEDPNVFDIARDPNHHLGFGFGIHYCLGAPLARLEARTAIGRLLLRYPKVSLAEDPDTLAWNPGFFLRGLRRLPVTVG